MRLLNPTRTVTFNEIFIKRLLCYQNIYIHVRPLVCFRGKGYKLSADSYDNSINLLYSPLYCIVSLLTAQIIAQNYTVYKTLFLRGHKQGHCKYRTELFIV